MKKSRYLLCQSSLAGLLAQRGDWFDNLCFLTPFRGIQGQGTQVNTAMAQMDKVTQQNAGNAEESASASEELSAQAESMNQAVGELVALVGSSTDDDGKWKKAASTTAQKTHELVTKHHGLNKSDHVFHRIAGNTGERAKTAKKASAPKAAAASVIPLDENSTDDLNEFNS